MSKPDPNARQTIFSRDAGYRAFVEHGTDGMSPCGLRYSELQGCFTGSRFDQFQKSNKAHRSRMYRNGWATRNDCLSLSYRNFVLRRGTSIMDPIIPEYFKEHKIHPLLKWPGGKSSDLKHLIANTPYLFPTKINNYYEPFLGGGAAWLSIKANEMFVNDLCEELIAFYRLIADQDESFFQIMDNMTANWRYLNDRLAQEEAMEIYGCTTDAAVVEILARYKKDLVDTFFCPEYAEEYYQTLCDIVPSKLKNIRRAEGKKNIKLPVEDIYDNIEGAFKAGMYTQVRTIMNKTKEATPLKVACFYFMRDYCFSSMFRYNSDGEFNVPYGGISYNSRDPNSKVKNWREQRVIDHLKATRFYNMDFLDFLRETKPGRDDFLFVDPPYDSEFSTYAKNEFTQEDQKRLADYLCEETDAQFMAIVKNTDRIYEMYQRPGVKCVLFDKNYSVSFMNRNAKGVQHLVVVRTY